MEFWMTFHCAPTPGDSPKSPEFFFLRRKWGELIHPKCWWNEVRGFFRSLVYDFSIGAIYEKTHSNGNQFLTSIDWSHTVKTSRGMHSWENWKWLIFWQKRTTQNMPPKNIKWKEQKENIASGCALSSIFCAFFLGRLRKPKSSFFLRKKETKKKRSRNNKNNIHILYIPLLLIMYVYQFRSYEKSSIMVGWSPNMGETMPKLGPRITGAPGWYRLIYKPNSK